MKKIILLSLVLVGCSTAGRELSACKDGDCVHIYKYSKAEYCEQAKIILRHQFPPNTLDCK